MLNIKHMHKSALIVSIICLVFSIFACKVGDFDETVDYTITYYYNKDDGSVVTSSFTNHVKKGTYLTGGPTSWSNGVWSTKDEVGFGYIGDGKIGAKGVFYKYVIEDKVWYFEQIENVEWDSTQAITTSLSLTPKYKTVESSESVVFNMVYYAPSAEAEIGYETIVEPKVFKTSEVEKETVYIRDLVDDFGLFELTKDSDIGYGYIDNSDHKHKYYFDSLVPPAGFEDTKPTYEFTLYDVDGGKLGDYSTDDLVTMEFNGKVLKPKYLSAGYSNISADTAVPGGIGFISQVFIPGNANSDGTLSPFPYSAAGSSKYFLSSNRVGKGTAASDNSVFYTDTDEAKLRVNDMYVMQVPLLSRLIRDIYTTSDDRLVNLLKTSPKYTLSSNLLNNLTTGQRVLDREIMTNLTYIDAITIANLLTDYYNAIHENETLTPVYHGVRVEEVAKRTKYNFGENTQANDTPNYYYEYPSDAKVYLSQDTKWTNSTYSFVYYQHVGNGTEANYNTYKNYRYIVVDESATGFRLPRDYEWEYMARIVTDERQVPNEDVMRVAYQKEPNAYYNTVLSPNELNGYKHYFQSAKGSFDDTTIGECYVGSGAGLAVWDGSRYNKTALRPYTKAVGKRTIADNTHSNSQTATYADSTGSFLFYDADGNRDENRKNGAGLYGMCNGVREFCDTYANITTSDSSEVNSSQIAIVMRGSSRDACSITNPDSCSIGSTYNNWLYTSIDPTTCGARFIRYVFN